MATTSSTPLTTLVATRYREGWIENQVERPTRDRMSARKRSPPFQKNDFSPMFAKTILYFQRFTAARFTQKRPIPPASLTGYKPLKSSLKVTFKAVARAWMESSRGTATPRSILLIVPRSIPLADSRLRRVSPRASRRVRKRALKVIAGCFLLPFILARILLSEYA